MLLILKANLVVLGVYWSKLQAQKLKNIKFRKFRGINFLIEGWSSSSCSDNSEGSCNSV